MVIRANGGMTLLNSRERCVRLGFPWFHCQVREGKKDQLSEEALEDIRCSMCGNSFSVPVVASLIGQALHHEGVVAQPPSVSECWGAPCAEDLEQLWAVANKDPEEITAEDVHSECCRAIVRSATYKGSDVRLATGSLQNPSGWPRRGVEAGHWKWQVCLSYPQHTSEHINVLELRALLATFRWRARRSEGLREGD